jgi:histidinol-phosphate aminotransferase
MSQYWSEFVHQLKPYVPGEQPVAQQSLVKLNTNENPFGPSPKVLAALQARLDDRLRLYPDPESSQLRGAIADYYQVRPAQVFVGNGSDEVLAHVFNALLRHDAPILSPQISYSFYPVYCELYGIERIEIPLDDDFRVRVADYQRPNGGIVVANPNAPTGDCLALAEIEQLLQQNPASVVVIDEAYIDFGGETAIGLVARYANLLVVQTLSKSRSLAGLRVGFAVGHTDLIAGLQRVKNSFNSYPLDMLAQVAAVAAIEDREWFDSCREQVISNRETLVDGLQALGFGVLPSAANFVFVRHPEHDAAELLARLREHGVIVRHFSQPAAIDQFLRISVGTQEQHAALFAALERILKSS